MRSPATLDLSLPEKESESLFEKEAAAPTKKARKHQKRDCIAKMERGELPLTVMVQLPDLQKEDGSTIPGLEVRCKTSMETKENVTIELSATALTYIRHANDDVARATRQEVGSFEWELGCAVAF